MRNLLIISFLVIAGSLGGGVSQVHAETPAFGGKKISESIHLKMKEGNFLEVVKDTDDVLFGNTPEKPVANEALTQSENQKYLRDILKARIEALIELNDLSKTDDFLSKFETVYSASWRALQAAAGEWIKLPGEGWVVEGKFIRGDGERYRMSNQSKHGESWRFASSIERDRIHACQLMERCRRLLAEEEDSVAVGWFYLDLADFILAGRNGNLKSWELQDLTNWSQLPEWETENPYSHYRRSSQVKGTPMNEDGSPITFSAPESFEAAANDGERWRWALEEAVRANRGKFIQENPKSESFNLEKAFRDEATLRLAQFYQRQFGEQTLQNIWSRMNEETDEELKRESGILALETLSDSETIARTATGIRRFDMPEGANYIHLYQQLASESGRYQKFALGQLAHISKNRRQYEKSVDYFEQRANAVHPPIPEAYCADPYSFDVVADLREQLTGNWGRFETLPQQTSENPQVTIQFRNATKAKFKAVRINLERIHARRKEEIKKYENRALNPRELSLDNFRRYSLNFSAESILNESTEFLTDEKTEWETTLNPLPGFRDTRLVAPLKVNGPGAWLVEMQIENGNRAFIVAWVLDTVLVQKTLDGKKWYFAMDSRTGTPIPGAILDFTGYRIETIDTKDRRRIQQRVHGRDFQLTADANGIWISTPEVLEKNFRYQVAVRRPDSSRIETFTDLNGFREDLFQASIQEFDKVSAFGITDRPIYRPEQKVQFKFWAERSAYEAGDYLASSADAPAKAQGKRPESSLGEYPPGPLANQKMAILIRNPYGETIHEQDVQSNEFGAVSGEFTLPESAALGQYQILLDGKQDDKSNDEARAKFALGAVAFRLEEYRKPEFEVRVEAPKAPVKLGDTIKATIQAHYFFGAPVANGVVTYRVFRQTHSKAWYAPSPWDWLYGPAYWWRTENYAWFPGWRHWGCPAPLPSWSNRRASDEELVLENEIRLTPEMEGTAEILIDSSLAAALYPDRDHQYRIEADVMDASRREITGSGIALAARKPFKVNVWTRRGFLNVGDQIPVFFAAKVLDGKGVEGKGTVRIFEISYEKDGTPKETEIQSAELATDAEGTASFMLKGDHPGQFRVAYLVTSNGENPETVEGAMIFTVLGHDSTDSTLRFNDLELIPDKSEYQPGETVRLLINVNQENSTVFLCERCADGICSNPKIIQIRGKSQIVEIPVRGCDQPNFFIEAFTTAKSQVYSASREICVPPEKRILNLEILPSKERFQPGEKAQVTLKLTDQNGKPFVGETVLTVYDKSLELLSDGTNVGDVYSHFWGWKRRHFPVTTSSASMKGRHLQKPNEKSMETFDGRFDLPKNRSGMGFDAFVVSPYVTRQKSLFSGSASGLRSLSMAPQMMVAKEMDEEVVATNEFMGAPTPTAGMNDAAPGDAPETFDDAFNEKDERADLSKTDLEAMGEISPDATNVKIRRSFADTAFWTASLKTDENGSATVDFPMPENLTTWKICAWAMNEEVAVGKAETEVITAKNLILRMQTPRFMTTSDEIVLSAIVHNYLESEKAVAISIALPENAPCRLLETSPQSVAVQIPPQGETRVDWRVSAENEGECAVVMKAVTDEESDAMSLSFPVHIHGMAKQDAKSGMISAEENAEQNAKQRSVPVASGFMDFTIPKARRIQDSALEIRFSPTLAGAMLDALPYLANFPYGCTEQTLNRFLPTVLVREALNDSGIPLSEIAAQTNNLNAQEIGDAQERNRQWQKQFPSRKDDLVFNEEKLNEMISVGVDRLLNMQCVDGGWGWFSGAGETSSAHLTSCVARGLLLAQRAEIFGEYENSEAVGKAISSALRWLQQNQSNAVAQLLLGEEFETLYPDNKIPNDEELPEKFICTNWKKQVDEMDVLVFATLAEAGTRSEDMDQMARFIFRDRVKLSPQSVSLAGIAFHQREEIERFQTILKYLNQFLDTDEENQTARLSLPNFCFWWFWYGNDVETQAAYLRLLCLDGTQESLNRAAYLVKYLLNHRKNAVYWNSTRDTALVLEAFTQYLRTTNELSPQMTVEVLLDGQLQKTVEITPKNLFTADLTFLLQGEAVTDGTHRVELRRTGFGPLYFNGYARYFTLEDFISQSGLEVRVNRKYFLLKPETVVQNAADANGKLVKQNVLRHKRIPLENGASVASGDLVEVELTVESKNDYSYLLIEDMKPAGFETKNQQSGYDGNSLGAYVEYRDDRVAFFVRALDEGVHCVSYRLKAETPGKVSALPTRIHAMYAPELKGNSDEMKLECVDKKD